MAFLVVRPQYRTERGLVERVPETRDFLALQRNYYEESDRTCVVKAKNENEESPRGGNQATSPPARNTTE